MTESRIPRPWSELDHEFDRVDTELVRGNDALFMLVCSASFVESGSDTYTANLVERFADDPEVGAWLREHWEPEELRHGRALETYVRRVWPNFDWDAAYADFFAEYSQLCTVEELEATRGQEMAARCIVEMGTTTYYEALHAACDEPVLRDLAWRIRTDEVNHYKHFHAYFLKYREVDRLGRGQVLAALVRRLRELRREDSAIALRHVATWYRRSRAEAGGLAPLPSTQELTRQAMSLVRAHLPIDLAVRMTLKPLLLEPRLQRWIARPLEAIGRSTILH